MEKGKRIETPLPEAMIQHIQSFLNGKEAARTTLLSKSWYNAWLTRPALAFDQRDFKNLHWKSFIEFATKTMRRYQDLNLKIESLRLQTQNSERSIDKLAHKLIVEAMKMGATDLHLEFCPSTFAFPQEVLKSETLLRLSLKRCEIHGNFNCSMLRSLSLDSVLLQSKYTSRDIVSLCVSIEEISISNPSISNSRRLALSRKNLYELHKLKRLHLEMVEVDYSFFEDLDSRFPCLKDLSLMRCQYDCTSMTIRIASTSLRRISIVQLKVMRAKFTVPNLASFSYSGMGVPSLSVEARECESYISLKTNHHRKSPWFLRLHKLLTQLSPSKINHSLDGSMFDKKIDIQDVAEKEPVVVENVTIEANFGSCALVSGLFWICRPKFVTHTWLPNGENYSLIKSIWETLMGEVIFTPNCSVPDHNLFGLKEVNVQVYEEILTEWRPLLLEEPLDAGIAPQNKRKIRFQLKW